jgi:lycopene beta-cyclase
MVTPAYRWGHVRFAGHGFDRIVDCRDKPYSMIRGEDFFGQMLPTLEAAGVNFFWEQPHVALAPGEVRVENLAKGMTTHRFDYVVDAAFDPGAVQAQLWQSFAGLRVATQTARFSPGVATLMELGPSAADSPINFIYMLPLSATEALVEHTTFSLVPLAEQQHLEAVKKWLSAQGITEWREMGRERGAIPMGIASGSASPWPRVGTAAGGVRAGTGYGFVGIKEQARQLSEAMLLRGLRAGAWQYSPTPLLLRLGDALFLRALRRAPLQGAELMGALLRRASDNDLVAFLGGAPTLSEAWRVMRCVPKRKMVAALCC